MPVHPHGNDIVDIGTKRRRLEKLSERGVGHGFERPDFVGMAAGAGCPGWNCLNEGSGFIDVADNNAQIAHAG